MDQLSKEWVSWEVSAAGAANASSYRLQEEAELMISFIEKVCIGKIANFGLILKVKISRKIDTGFEDGVQVLKDAHRDIGHVGRNGEELHRA